ncbi:MAG TPA: 30S ribosomal protein S12 methylthiotransferase RimO, partial [Planctomycetaceae bacterium]|nr:30S ribosomal protein S12 methylthiotransferase RimO [Planctomycetaceae bacterium]
GYAIQAEPEGADYVIVNTCGFIAPAKEESLEVIRRMARLKRRGSIGALIVCGCLPERERERLLEQVPEIDALVGVFGREQIADVLARLESDRRARPVLIPAPARDAFDDRARLRITYRHYAYLKIAEGCDRTCTFCTIPKIRGPYVSKPIEQVVEEAAELAEDGTRELILVAQDTTYYGSDLYGRPRLAELIRQLEPIGGIRWIRLLYCYPDEFSDELIETIADSPKVVPYLDLPLQHISDRMLRLMGRGVTRSEIEGLIERLRARVPGLVLRTTLLVGSPGEGEREFEELLAFVRTARFERLGVFTYYDEPETPAAKLPGHVPGKLKRKRREQLMREQQRVAFEWSRSQVGRTLELIIDEPAPTRP